MIKCLHGWYIPSWWDNKETSPYCSGCVVSLVGIVVDINELKKAEIVWNRKLQENTKP